ncbi:MAG TPA: murein L,D-transpeptidase family protein [Pseudolabrys sp.]|nr:murein L,D-transpeptidase family protein [Pseudolabrys sp.]
MKRPLIRALLASAALAAAVMLAGCNADDITPTGRAQAPLSDKMVSLIGEKNMDQESPILIRLFKEESELEVWKKNRDGEYALLKTYPICRWSGDLGPKKKEGDRQAPEGFYTITPGQMNPRSAYYLAFNTGFPNAYDRSHGYTGSELMVHGDCSSRGCYAMTDEQIQEIYALARDSFFGGQKAFQFEAFPFRMTALNMAKHRNNPNFAFWKMLKEGYDHFEATRQEPKVAVCEKRYVFDPAAPDGATRAPTFSPSGACPAYQLDKTIADAVLEQRRTEQLKMAEYIAQGIATAAPHVGDGGMNPVFAEKLHPQQEYDSSGRLIEVATAPGALPRAGGVPATTVVLPESLAQTHPEALPQAQPAAAPVVLANVPLPEPAPQPKEGVAPEHPTTIAGLIGNLFGSQAQAAQDSAPVTLRGASSDLTAKPKRNAGHRATPAAARTPTAPAPVAKPKSAAATAPQPPTAPVEQAAAHEPAPAPTPATDSPPELRTAFSATQQAGTKGVVAGAQPPMPTGSFASRWFGLR